jgi:Tol biopolymer transport system component
VHALALDADLRPRGTARRLTHQQAWGNGLAWTPDGRSVVYGVYGDHLWRVRADGSSPPERVELAGRGADLPFAVASSDRLGFRRSIVERDVYRFEVGAAAAAPLIASTGSDTQPQYSPDGKRIALESDRDGDATALWLADADGSKQERFTHGPGRSQVAPRWSPDGRTLVFEAQGKDGGWDTWTIGSDGSGLRQVTRGGAGRGPSSWSHDGRRIYFSSMRTGRCEIWRVGAAGGPEEQVTREGGWMPFESPDGGTLYYKRAESEGPLLARPTAGGAERTVIECVPIWGWIPDAQGVFHLDCAGPADSQRRALRHWDAKTGRDRVLTTLDSGPAWPLGLSVSPDGRSILFAHTASSNDLMMIENFR